MSLNHVSDAANEKSEYKLILNEKIDLDDVPLTEDTTCGIWWLKGICLQKFANKKAYVVLYGILGCMFSATYAYHNGIITTLEKRFKIPSRTTGIITIGNDLSQLFVSIVLSYYTGRKHRPRWMALGMYTVAIYCLLTASAHWLYGPGEDALQLTEEYGQNNFTSTADILKRKTLCHNKNTTTECEIAGGNYAPQIIFFSAQFISGIGAPLYHTLGVSYMDDNIRKSKTPAFLSFTFFLKMLGPAIGYSLSSFCLRLYISPTLTPTITNKDPRWMGAWWLGWIILASLIFLLGSLLALFPKTLPRAAARKMQKQISLGSEPEVELPTSFKDMIKTFKRLMSNKILMINNLATIFYFFGYTPYWIFLPKYIETQYRQSAAASSLITGTAGLLFSAAGVLLSGLIISKCKPRARYLAGWNVIVGTISVLGILSYAYLGCAENNNRVPIAQSGEMNPISQCNKDCGCDFAKYNPVCSSDGKSEFITACHAGCRQHHTINDTKWFSDCSCIAPEPIYDGAMNDEGVQIGGSAKQGNCFVDCINKFYTFLAVVCLLKFTGATGRASNFLVSVRCVDEKDKPVAMGFGLTMISLFAFIPSPIIFGAILDKTCLLWDETCNSRGNCWVYNGETLRHILNYTSAIFVAIGTIFDIVVWYLVKHLKIFDDDNEDSAKEKTTKIDDERDETELNKL